MAAAARAVSGGAALAAAAACGPFQPAGRQRTTGPVQLVFGRRSSAAELPVLQGYVEKYRAVVPQVSVELAVMPAGLQEMRAGLLTAAAGGTAPDLFISDGPWLPEFATKGLFDRLPREAQRDLQANFTEGGQRYGTYKGTAYVYPYETVMHGLYYNRQLFAQAGLDPNRPPRTFAEFRDAARRVAQRDAGGTLVQPGFVANNRLLYVENFVYNNGGRVINEDEFGNLRSPYKLTLGEPKALEALQLHWDLHNADRSADVRAPPPFAQGTAGMVITTNGYVRTMATQAPAVDYRIAPLPTQLARPAHQLGGWSWGVSASGRAKDVAWALLQWLNNKENVLSYVATLAAVTTHKGAIADPRAVTIDPARMPVFYQVLPAVTHVRPKAVTWSEIEALAEPEMQRMFAGEMTPRQLLDKIEGPLHALLAKEP